MMLLIVMLQGGSSIFRVTFVLAAPSFAILWSFHLAARNLFRHRFSPQDLALDQPVVEPATGHQLGVPALFHHRSSIQHDDVVGSLHCTQPVGYHQHRVFLDDAIQSLLNLEQSSGITLETTTVHKKW